MGKRLLLGILKGLFFGGILGAAVHYGLETPKLDGGLNYLLYGLVGALSGTLSGRAPWKPGAWIASVLKAIFGIVVGVGLYALGERVLPAVQGPGLSEAAKLAFQPLLFAPMVAVLYATFVELDDGGDQPEEATTGVRAGKISVEDIDVGEEEVAKPAAKSAKKN
jgi:uncharacterized membrane protein YeaQ/YmgE (transglycosylase-associated protein family)